MICGWIWQGWPIGRGWRIGTPALQHWRNPDHSDDSLRHFVEPQVGKLVKECIEPAGLTVERIARCPYLCLGDTRGSRMYEVRSGLPIWHYMMATFLAPWDRVVF